MFRCFGKQKNISFGGFNESHKLQYFSVNTLPPLAAAKADTNHEVRRKSFDLRLLKALFYRAFNQ